MKRPDRKDYINKATKIQLIADQELYIDSLEAEIKQLRIGSVSKSFICHDADTYGEGAKCSEMCVDCRDFNK